MKTVDLDVTSLRDLNQMLHDQASADHVIEEWNVANPRGQHSIAAGLNAALNVNIDGNVGYYCAGMNQLASVTIDGRAGVGVAENMMSGHVHVKGDASQSAGATGCGGMLVIDGNASARCGISNRGLNIVVKGSIGHMSAFMAQAGTLTVLGDAGDALGDSIYEAQLFVRGTVRSLGTDCIEKPLNDPQKQHLAKLLDLAGLAGEVDVAEFKRYGSARRLYNFQIDNLEAYG
ncbi:MAG: protein glxC [Pseudomonadota bacterium]